LEFVIIPKILFLPFFFFFFFFFQKDEEEEEEDEGPSLEDMLPRTDISAQITDSLTDMFEAKSWKERKKGLEKVDALVKGANKRIEPNLGGLMSALGRRMLTDVNKNLIIQTLKLLDLLAEAAGAKISRYSKAVISGMIACLADAKKQVQDASATALKQWVHQAGVGVLVPFVEEGVAKVKPARLALLKILQEGLEQFRFFFFFFFFFATPQNVSCFLSHVEGHPHKEAVDYAHLINPLVECLQDKTAPVRAAAENVLGKCVEHEGYKAISSRVKKLKPASRKQIDPILTKFRLAQATGDDDDDDDASSVASSKKKGKKGASKVKAVKKAGAAAPAAKKKRKAAVVEESESEPESEEEPEEPSKITVASKKLKRMKVKGRKYKGEYTDFSKEDIEELKALLQPLIEDKKLNTLMFHRDFKKHQAAIKLLIDGMDESTKKGIMAQSDLVLQWLAWKITEGKTAVFTEALDLVHLIVMEVEEMGGKFYTRECDGFVPALVEKMLGNNKGQFREKAAAALLDMARVFDKTKVSLFFFCFITKKQCECSKSNLHQFECRNFLCFLDWKLNK
jgi:cytoskeleton-associated protein 5